MAVLNRIEQSGSHSILSQRERVSPILSEGVRLGHNQHVFLVLDIDETTVQGCTAKHDRAFRLWASLRGYTGELPSREEVIAFGYARPLFEKYLDNADCLEGRMRGSTVVHKLEAMDPELALICTKLQRQKLRPTLSITARPEHLQAFSQQELRRVTGLEIPVLAMPQSIPVAEAGEWKIEQLQVVKRLLKLRRKEKPIVIFDDSTSLCRSIAELGDPDIFCLRFQSEPTPDSMEANWRTLADKLREIKQFWQEGRVLR